MAVTIINPKSHDEWLALRGTGIGSSEVGAILGVNPYDTPFQVWQRKTGRAASKPETLAMRLGHEFEPITARLYSEATGAAVDESTAGDWLARSDRREYTIASPDRICTAKDGRKVLLELKSTNLNVSEDDYPKSWFCQVQYLLTCSEMTDGALAWLNVSKREFGYKRIVADRQFQEWMLSKLDKFWTENVLGDKAPDPVNADDIALQYPMAEHKSITASDEVYKACLELRAKKDELRTLQADIQALEDSIKMFMGDADTLTCGLDTLATWRNRAGRVTVDSALLRKEFPDIFDRVSKMGASTRTFLLKSA